jgi:uncharacterized protein (TIGR03437 family)
MYRPLAALAFELVLYVGSSQNSTAPSYSAASIVNSATGTAGALAPNTIASIYGSNLAYETAGFYSKSVGGMPRELAGVHVFVAGIAAALYYVSPQQINFLIPHDLRPGDMNVFVAREGTAGPQIRITLHDMGPGIYQRATGIVSCTHSNGSVISKDHPARPGEIVVVYGTGWGRTNPDIGDDMSMMTAPLAQLSAFRVLVAGTALGVTSVSYAGVTPGYPGLYQVKFNLPPHVLPNPEIRVAVGDQTSPANLKMPLQ